MILTSPSLCVPPFITYTLPNTKEMKIPSQIRINRALEGLPALRKLAAGNVAMLRHLKVFQETALHCQEAELIDKAGETNMDI